MSLYDIPEIPGVDPAAVKALTRLCSGPAEERMDCSPGPSITWYPRLLDLDNETYVSFTDGATAILVALDPEKLPILESGEEFQKSFGKMLEVFTVGATKYHGVDAAAILQWASEGTHKCPRCKGTRTCMYPKQNTTASRRENPDILEAHRGWLGDACIDRRRLQLPLHMLGIDEGGIEIIVAISTTERTDDTGALRTAVQFQGVALLGDGWRIYTAGLSQDLTDGAGNDPRFKP